MKLAVLIAVLPGISLAFTPLALRVERSSKAVLAMRKMRNDKNTVINDVFLRPFGTMLVAASLILNPGSSGAVEHASFSMSQVASSSLQIAEEIKLLDMSLPTYGSISDPKANQESIEFVKQKKEDNNAGAAAAAAKKKPGNNPLVVTKSKPMKEQKPAVERKVIAREPFEKRERVIEPKEPKDEVLNNFKSKPVYIQKEAVSVEEKKKEKEAKKAEIKSVKKEKEVVTSEEKEDGLSLKDVEVVNMEMPSYDKSTTKKAKSAFAL